MENDLKLNVLVKIAKSLNAAGIAWAVGGSMLLYFKHITDEFQDIDLIVAETDVETVKALLSQMGSYTPSKPNPKFRTKAFFEFAVDGVDIDVMAGFAIVKDGAEHRFSLTKDEIRDCVILQNEKIPLHSLRAWRGYYALMGKPEKVRLIDAAL